MKKRLEAFTLVEMLIVMGILAILMTIGISVGRFAIQRANNIQHQSATDQIAQAMQSYYTDKRRYPNPTGTDEVGTNFSDGILDKYIDASFDGGSAATYYYDVSQTNQAYLVCVSLGGQDDVDGLGFYCTGDGFEETDVFGTSPNISEKNYPEDHADYAALKAYFTTSPEGVVAQWDGQDWNAVVN